MAEKEMTFGKLIDSIQLVHGEMASQAGKAVNISLTLRNWIIGYYIREYEQNGSDRAEYGRKLLSSLASQLESKLDKCYTERYIRLCRQLFDRYPQIRKSLVSESRLLGIRKSVISEFEPKQIVQSVTAQLSIPSRKLINSLSFTHLAELIKIEDNLKRVFYEIECIKGCWSVRELKRQIASLYYERSGLCGKAALECAGKPKARLRFWRRIASASKSGVALCFPPHSKIFIHPNEAGCLVYI